MKTIFMIALRNIMRQKRRTIQSAAIIAVGLLFYIYMDSMMVGMDQGSLESMVELSSSSVKVYTEQYNEERETYPLKYGIDNHKEVISFLKSDKNVEEVAPRTPFLAEVSNGVDNRQIIGTVIDEKLDTLVFGYMKYLDGSFFTGDFNEIVMGQKLAEEMGVKVGDYITVYALTRFDSRNGDEFEIVGLLNTPDPAINSSAVYITYTEANNFLDLENLVIELNTKFVEMNLDTRMKQSENVKASTQDKFGELKLLSFVDLAETILNISEQKKKFGFIFVGMILLIAAVGIFNTILMSMYERIREIGLLKALGMKERDILFIFMLEGVITGTIGSIIGLIFGALINIYLVEVGFDMTAMAGEIDFGMPISVIRGVWSAQTFVIAFVFGVLSSVIASYIPAKKAAKLSVVKAIRF